MAYAMVEWSDSLSDSQQSSQTPIQRCLDRHQQPQRYPGNYTRISNTQHRLTTTVVTAVDPPSSYQAVGSSESIVPELAKSSDGPPMPVTAVNYHAWAACNMGCSFCFAHFGRSGLGDGEQLPRSDMIAVSRLLGARFDKVNIAGGEPLLCPWIDDVVAAAHTGGATTSLVTNGSVQGARILDRLAGHLDWLCLSVDAASPDANRATGRALGGRRPLSAGSILRFADMARERGIAIKLNTVVTTANQHEDLRPLVSAIRPQRWKILRMLPIGGENDAAVSLVPDALAFQTFIDRHASVRTFGVEVIHEDHEDMRGSYAMVDPAGRCFDNWDGRLHLGERILAVGLDRAIASVRIDQSRFLGRGGQWAWRAERALSVIASALLFALPLIGCWGGMQAADGQPANPEQVLERIPVARIATVVAEAKVVRADGKSVDDAVDIAWVAQVAIRAQPVLRRLAVAGVVLDVGCLHRLATDDEDSRGGLRILPPPPPGIRRSIVPPPPQGLIAKRQAPSTVRKTQGEDDTGGDT